MQERERDAGRLVQVHVEVGEAHPVGDVRHRRERVQVAGDDPRPGGREADLREPCPDLVGPEGEGALVGVHRAELADVVEQHVLRGRLRQPLERVVEPQRPVGVQELGGEQRRREPLGHAELAHVAAGRERQVQAAQQVQRLAHGRALQPREQAAASGAGPGPGPGGRRLPVPALELLDQALFAAQVRLPARLPEEPEPEPPERGLREPLREGALSHGAAPRRHGRSGRRPPRSGPR